MEVNHSSRSGRDATPLRADLTRKNREGIARAVEATQQVAESDRVELSEAGQSYVADLEETSEASAEHRAKVAEIMELYRSGTLNSPERIERAAEGLLSEES